MIDLICFRKPWPLMNSHSLSVILSLLLCCIAGCRGSHSTEENRHDGLQQIKDSGELVVLTLYSSTSYFIYRGQDMGFQYELSEQFAKSLGVKLRIEVVRSVHELIEQLQADKGDLIAYNLPITKEWKDSLIYCGEEIITHQVIVQRTGGGSKPLKDVTELIGKDVYVKPGKHYERLVNLDEELGGGIHIHQVTNDSISTEDLIRQVAQGEIPYTVADNHVAQLNATYYPNLNIGLSISFDQRSSWAVRKDSPQLAAIADKWHAENVTSPAYTASMKRYFEISKTFLHSPILSLREGKISHYDDLFKKYAPEIDWDWRLLASLAYTESNFDTTAVSWAGAKGLMQLMPATARAMGVPAGKEQNPEESIKAAIKYIAATDKSFTQVPQDERINFVLASYNSGIGHVQDAMALAEKYGKKKYVWKDNVETFILLKSNEEYFTDPVCKNGYFRGIETCNFVRDIISRFEQYKKKIKDTSHPRAKKI
ncbi:membrane-bound lytic murein transglycosylase F [Bacteroides zoogleoformans]|nr:membrane-bound lytic murein transglycosylase F [Bacteroides zoogleoformans]